VEATRHSEQVITQAACYTTWHAWHCVVCTSACLTYSWLLLGLASPVSGSSLTGLTATFHSLRLETPPTWRAKSPYLYPSGTGWPSYTPGHWVTSTSPLTTHRYSTRQHRGSSLRDSKSRLCIYYDRRSVGQSVLVSDTNLFTLSCGFIDEARGRDYWP
jgi:hypothetical protein